MLVVVFVSFKAVFARALRSLGMKWGLTGDICTSAVEFVLRCDSPCSPMSSTSVERGVERSRRRRRKLDATTPSVLLCTPLRLPHSRQHRREIRTTYTTLLTITPTASTVHAPASRTQNPSLEVRET